MPMKCMDQIPLPMASDPPASHQRAELPFVAVMRPAIARAVYEASMATAMEMTTSQALYVLVSIDGLSHVAAGLLAAEPDADLLEYFPVLAHALSTPQMGDVMLRRLWRVQLRDN